MKEKLIIKNFGPIKNVELELGKFNVLIGDQATGKSTVAKVLAVCRYFSYLIPYDDWEGSNFMEGLKAWGLNEFILENTVISYKCQHYSLEVSIDLDNEIQTEFGDAKIPMAKVNLEPFSQEFKKLLEELEKINPNSKEGYGYYETNWKPSTSFFLHDVATVMDNPFYLPTERGLQSIFSLGKTSIQNISDSLFNQFAKLDQIARSFKEETLIEPLGIIYKNVDGRGYVRKKNKEKFYSVFNGASGYQSTIPNVLAIKYYSEQKIKKKNKTFIIEEPELNLYPAAQAELMKFFAGQIQFHNGFLLTTHSPYILTSLNNLMYAHQVGQEHDEEVNKIIDKKYWVNSQDVSAYQLLPDGSCENIIAEDGLIMAEKIDVISRQINSEFDLMQDIKLGIESINS